MTVAVADGVDLDVGGAGSDSSVSDGGGGDVLDGIPCSGEGEDGLDMRLG